MSRLFLSVFLSSLISILQGQTIWLPKDADFPGLPSGLHVFRTETPIDGRPNIAWYVEASLKGHSLRFDTDSTLGRRLTPSQFKDRNPGSAVVVNGTFFSFADHRNLNVLIRRGRLVGYNILSIPGRGKDTLTFHHVTRSALGIDRKGNADVAWLYTDSARHSAIAISPSPASVRDSFPFVSLQTLLATSPGLSAKPWKMETAIGGGPVLIQDGKVQITNNEERMFVGKAREDLHPRTAMGYTRDGRLLILAVEGRNKGTAEGASLTDLARLLLELGAVEALNLDGGGSSCLLVMGKETIRPSDKEGQRAVPGVFMVSAPGTH